MSAAQHRVHPTGGSLRVYRHFAWLEVGSGKTALSRPAHQRVTLTVGRYADTDDRRANDERVAQNTEPNEHESVGWLR